MKGEAQFIANVRDLEAMGMRKVAECLLIISDQIDEGVRTKLENVNEKHQANISKFKRPGYEKSDHKLALLQRAQEGE